MPPFFEFVIPQGPLSQRAKSRSLRRWKETVEERARASMTESFTLATDPIALTLLYFYDEKMVDLDNVLKPIQDALSGVIYEDDSLITDVVVRGRRRRTTFKLNDVSPVLAEGLDLGKEFIFISIEEPPPQDTLP
jgi:Holliday junction resolvase RusA-like endonuclease